MPDFRRGAAAIEESAQSKGGGGYRPFVPKIQWRDDKEEHYVLFLTPVDEIPTVMYHDWIPVGKGEKANGEEYTIHEEFISRKDPAIGESTDDLEDRLDVKPKERNIAVAVELEAEVEEDERGRKRAVGFVVATDTYTRKTDNGEEEVTQPKIGLVIQAAQNFYGWLASYDSSQGPIEETPMQVTRRGKDANTTYDFIALDGRGVDLGPLLEEIGGVSYLEEEMEDLLSAIEESENDQKAAEAIAAVLLDKRLEELADAERYEKLVSPVTEVPKKFGAKKKGGNSSSRRERPSRPARQSRRSAKSEEAPAEPAAEKASEPAAKETPAEKPKATKNRSDRFAELRAKVEAKNKNKDD